MRRVSVWHVVGAVVAAGVLIAVLMAPSSSHRAPPTVASAPATTAPAPTTVAPVTVPGTATTPSSRPAHKPSSGPAAPAPSAAPITPVASPVPSPVAVAPDPRPQSTAISPGAPVGVPAGDYLLTATLTGTPGAPGEVDQLVGGGGTPQRTADFHLLPGSNTVNAQVRVTGQADQFAARMRSGTVAVGAMTLHAMGWGYVVRGSNVVSAGDANVLLHGVNALPVKNAGDVASSVATFPRIGAVRVLVGENCWLAFFSAAQQSCAAGGPAAYQAQVRAIVATTSAEHRVSILSVGLAGADSPATIATNALELGPDQHTLLVYDDLVRMFAANPYVIFETYNEPQFDPNQAYPPSSQSGPSLWRDGGTVTGNSLTWRTPGVQQQVARMRADGASNVIMVEGESWGEDLTPVETNPVDGTNLMYSYHAYNPVQPSVSTLLDSRVGPLLDPAGAYRYAGFMTEFGSDSIDYGFSGTGAAFLTSAIGWAQAHGTGWAVWGWYPNWWDHFGILANPDPVAPDSRGQVVTAAF